MALGGFYNTGTVTIASGGVAVTGLGSLWSMQIEVGDWLLVNGQVGVILVVTDDTHLTLATAWQGTLPSAAAYVILKMSWLRYDPALTQAKIRELLAELIEQGNFIFTTVAPPDPALGEDGQWALKTDVSPWRLWYKTGGVWVEQQAPAGLAWKGAWSSSVTYSPNDAVQSGGSSYISKTNNTNKPPASNPADWDLMASQGNAGAPGTPGTPGSPGAAGPPGMVWRGAWNSATAYAINDAVSYQGNSYIAVVANTNSVPPNANWNLLAQGGSGSALPVLQEFTATAGQTTFTVATGYTVGKIWVTRDGVVADFADYTATNGSTVVFVTPCEAGEVVKVMGNLDTKNGAIIPRFRYIATAGQTTFSGPDANGQTLTYQSSAAIEVFAKGALLPATAYTATSGTSVVLSTGLAAGDVLEVVAFAYTQMSDGISYLGPQTLSAVQQLQARANIYAAPFDALAFSGMQVNGGHDIAQQYGETSFTVPNATGTWPVDCWSMDVDNTSWQIQTDHIAPAFGPAFGAAIPWCTRVYAITGGGYASAANSYAIMQSPIEGVRFSRMNWGTANARYVTIAFWFVATVTGTFALCLRNSVANRTYIHNFTVSTPNVWQYCTVTVPGDTSGAWLVNNLIGLRVGFCFGAGTTWQTATLDAWQAGNFMCSTAQTNFFAASNNYLEITGLTVTPGLDVPPIDRQPMLLRPPDGEIRLCQRHLFVIKPGAASADICSGFVVDTTNVFYAIQFPVAMRTTPSGAQSNAADWTNAALSATSAGVSATFANGSPNAMTYRLASGTHSGSGGQTAFLRSTNANAWLAFKAQL